MMPFAAMRMRAHSAAILPPSDLGIAYPFAPGFPPSLFPATFIAGTPMSVRISWANPNPIGTPEDSVRVYRSLTPMSEMALPAPIDTLPAGSLSYLDTSAVDGTTYYYRVGYVRSGTVYVSSEITVVAPAGGVTPASKPLPPMTASGGVLLDQAGQVLYRTGTSDKVVMDWASTRKLLAAMVVWEEKKAVWDTELVTMASSDFTDVPAEFMSGLVAGDQVTWKGIVQLMLVPSKSDIAATVTRVLGAELATKYGVGATAQEAIGYWMANAALRAGSANSLATTNSPGAVTGEVINQALAWSARSSALGIRAMLGVAELASIASQKSVTVPVSGPSPRNLTHASLDMLQAVQNIAGTPTGATLQGYIGGKTGDNTTGVGSQSFVMQAPSGARLAGVVYQSTSRQLRNQDIRRMMMAVDNDFPTLRGAESSTDPYAAMVKVRVLSTFPPEDVGPATLPITNTGVTSVPNAYMDGLALSFNGSAMLTVGGTLPALAGDDFTAEVFLLGPGVSDSADEDVFGLWNRATNNRSWSFQVTPTGIQFLYSMNGVDAIIIPFAIDRDYVKNGSPMHLCAQRSGGAINLFVNGQPAVAGSVSGAIFAPAAGAASLLIGARQSGSGGENFYRGLVQEAILTVGVARYPMDGFMPRYRKNRW